MPRRRSSFGRSSRSRRSSTTRTPPRTSQQSQPQQKSGGLFSGLMGTMFQGMAFGAGSEVAHTAVRGMMGGDSGHGQAPPQEAPAQGQSMNRK